MRSGSMRSCNRKALGVLAERSGAVDQLLGFGEAARYVSTAAPGVSLANLNAGLTRTGFPSLPLRSRRKAAFLRVVRGSGRSGRSP